MNVGKIKTAIKNSVDDQSIDDLVLLEWIIAADDAIQTWKPREDQAQTFDWFDFLKDIKNYITAINVSKYALPDDFRAFIELKIGTDTEPYKLIDYRDRANFTNHKVYILGKYFYVIGTPASTGQSMSLTYVRFTEEITGDTDEPEIERSYHQAYIEYGKKKYYAQQGDTELEDKAEANFEGWMNKKWRDQELARMQTASDSLGVNVSSIV
jgi:hypothetical protein